MLGGNPGKDLQAERICSLFLAMPKAIASRTITVAYMPDGIDSRRALLIGGLCWAGFGLIAWAMSAGWMTGLDAAGLRLLRDPHSGAFAGSSSLAEALRDITALGGPVLRWMIALATAAGLLFVHLRREAVVLIATMLSGLLVESILKGWFGRARPDLVPHLTPASGFSFPSGHSFNSALVLIGCALAVAALSQRQSVRLALIGGAALMSMLVAFSRVALGVHYPSDVIAGWLGGAGWAFLAAGLLKAPVKAATAT